jgi:hypothetical protein
VILRGNEILEKPQSDAILRDISDAETVGASELRERIHSAIRADGYAKLDSVISEIRGDEKVHLPKSETKTVAREAVNDFLVDDHVLEAGGRYLEELADRDPTAVKLLPTVGRRAGEKISNYIEDLEAGDQFTVNKVADRFDDSVNEYMIRSFLLQSLGLDVSPEFVISTTGSEEPSDWVPGYPFRKADLESDSWRFEFNGDDVTELRRKWRDENQAGTVEYGDITMFLTGEDGVPESLEGTAEVIKTQLSLTLDSGQHYTNVQDLLERMPSDATNIKIEIRFNI